MKKILSLLISFFMATQAFASIAIMPTTIELNTNKIRSNYASTSIEVKGDNVKAIRFKVYPGYFKINEKGEAVQIEQGTEPNDISKKIKFVPSEFTVQPGKSQKVRLNIVGLNTLPDGENRGLIYIEDVQPQLYPVNTGMSGFGAQIIVKSRIAIPIYLDKGKYIKKGEMESFSVTKEKDGQYVNAKIISTGNSKIRYQARIQIYDDNNKLIKEQSILGGVVGDNNYRNVKEKIDTKDIPAGSYTLRCVFSYTDERGKKQVLKQESGIQIKGEM